MAKPRMDLSALVGKLLSRSRIGRSCRRPIRLLSQALVETEVVGSSWTQPTLRDIG